MWRSMYCSQAWSASEALPSATDISCTVHEPRASEKRTEEQGKMKSKHKCLSRDKPGPFSYTASIVISLYCTHEKQSISVTFIHQCLDCRTFPVTATTAMATRPSSQCPTSTMFITMNSSSWHGSESHTWTPVSTW